MTKGNDCWLLHFWHMLTQKESLYLMRTLHLRSPLILSSVAGTLCRTSSWATKMIRWYLESSVCFDQTCFDKNLHFLMGESVLRVGFSCSPRYLAKPRSLSEPFQRCVKKKLDRCPNKTKSVPTTHSTAATESLYSTFWTAASASSQEFRSGVEARWAARRPLVSCLLLN